MQPAQDTATRIARASETLQTTLTPYVQQAMRAVYGDEWREQARKGLRDPYLQHKTWDVHALLLIMHNNWHAVFNESLGETTRLLVNELRTFRSQDVPQPMNPADAYRVLDTTARLLHAVGDAAGAQAVQQDAFAVMQLQFQQPTPAPDDTVELPRASELIEQTRRQEETEEPESPTSEAESQKPADTEPGTRNPEPETPKTRLRGWFGRLLHKDDEQDLEPLELRTRVLDAVEDALKRFRSTRPLPFNRITVHILAPTAGDRLTYETALDDLDPPFDRAVHHRLRDAGFDVPDHLGVRVKIHADAPKRLESIFEEYGPIYVDLKQQTSRITATITVIKGAAEKDTYRVRSTERINIGRLREVVEDRYGHIVRRNDIAFLDHNASDVATDDIPINETVSRRHARIEFDERTGTFVLINEQGVTSVSRTGFPRPVRVTHQAVPLQDGDRIYLGQACLHFETKRR